MKANANNQQLKTPIHGLSHAAFKGQTIVVQLSFLILGTLKPPTHVEEKAEQTTSRGGLLRRFLTSAGKLR